MAVQLPYPDKPKNGDAPDAGPILANLLALLQAIQSFDAGQIASKTLTEGAFADAVNPRLRDGVWMGSWVESGGFTSSFTSTSWTMPSGVVWQNGYRAPFVGQTFSGFGANTDNYISITQAGAINPVQAVANNAAAPTLPANSQFVARIATLSTAITRVDDLRALTPFQGIAPVWQTPTLQNGWVAFDAGGTSGWGTVQYWKDAFGVVHLRGLIKSGTATAGTVLFNVPQGYRPAVQMLFEVTSNDARGRIDVMTTGNFVTGTGITSNWISFANISYRAEL